MKFDDMFLLFWIMLYINEPDFLQWSRHLSWKRGRLLRVWSVTGVTTPTRRWASLYEVSETWCSDETLSVSRTISGQRSISLISPAPRPELSSFLFSFNRPRSAVGRISQFLPHSTNYSSRTSMEQLVQPGRRPRCIEQLIGQRKMEAVSVWMYLCLHRGEKKHTVRTRLHTIKRSVISCGKWTTKTCHVERWFTWR